MAADKFPLAENQARPLRFSRNGKEGIKRNEREKEEKRSTNERKRKREREVYRESTFA